MKRDIHVWLDPDVVRDIDEFLGPRRRSAFIAEVVRRRLEDARRVDPDDLWAPERTLWARNDK